MKENLQHEVAKHFKISDEQLGLRAQLIPNDVQLRLKNFLKAFCHAIFNSHFLEINMWINAFQFLHHEVHQVEEVSLNLRHFRRHWNVEFDGCRFEGFQVLLNQRMKPRPKKDISNEEITHHFFEVTVTIRERLS